MSTTTESGVDLEFLNRSTATAWPQPNDVRDLARVAFEALKLKSPRYLRSIFGGPTSWLPPHRRFSEFNIVDPWRLASTIRYLLDATIPAAAVTTPDWARTVFPPVVTRRFWRPTHFYRQPDTYGGVSTYPEEHWFFINGIGTNEDVARLNSSYLALLFHRPISVVQNATDSIFLDLYECAIGKGFKTEPNSDDRKTMTEPAWRATSAILEAVNAKRTERVLILAHSQGTIIVANVLRAVAKALERAEQDESGSAWHEFAEGMMGGVQTETQTILRNNLAHGMSELTADGVEGALRKMAKVEVYTFANCADRMCYVNRPLKVPYMEHFANECDLVARLGVLSPLRGGPDDLIEIDGAVFEQKAAWGHLLNEHYLMAIDDYLYPRASKRRRDDNPYTREDGLPTPRLYGYFHGNTPAWEPPSRSWLTQT